MIGYAQNPICSYIYAVEFTFTEFGHQESNFVLFTQALDHIILTTATKLKSRKDLEQQPDLVSDFFGLAMRILRYNETVFFGSGQLPLFG